MCECIFVDILEIEELITFTIVFISIVVISIFDVVSYSLCYIYAYTTRTHIHCLNNIKWCESCAGDAGAAAECKIAQQCEYCCIILSAGVQEVSLTWAAKFYNFSAKLTPLWMGMNIVELLNSFHCYLNTQNSLCIVRLFYSPRIIFIHIHTVYTYGIQI